MQFNKISNAFIILFKGVLWILFFCGLFHPELMRSRRARCIARLYCKIVVFIYVLVYVHEAAKTLIPYYLAYPILNTYVVHALISYFFSRPLDFLRDVISKCRGRKSKAIFLGVMTVFFAEAIIPIFVIYWASFKDGANYSLPFSILTVMTPMINSMSRATKIFSISILYGHIRILFVTIKTKGFRFTPVRQDYIKAYESIHEGFEKVEMECKLTIIMNLITMFSVILICVNTIQKQLLDEDFKIWEPFFLLSLTSLLYVYTFCMIPIYWLASIADTEDELVAYVINKRLICSDQRTRMEMRRLVKYVRARPLRFTLFRAVPLDGRLAFGVLSLFVTYVIALLQLSIVSRT